MGLRSFVETVIMRLSRSTQPVGIGFSISFGASNLMLDFKKGGYWPQWIVIHHSLTEDGSPKNWDAIRKFHIEERGWNDIGYNLGMENVNGKITLLEGRPIGSEGAHARAVQHAAGHRA